MPVYMVGVIQRNDITPGFDINDTVGGTVEGVTFTVSASASPITIFVDDDDLEFDDGFIDPPGFNTGSNNQLISEPVTINGVNYGPATSGGTPNDQIELEFAFTTTDGDTYYMVRIDGTNVGLSGPTLPQAGQEFTVDESSDSIDTAYDQVPCFADGTMIQTPHGPVAVEALKDGDLVDTFDDGPQPLLRVLSRRLSPKMLFDQPDLRPIVFQPGAAGNSRTMRLSPQHRVMVSGWRAELYFGTEQVLVPAKSLVNATTVSVAPPDHGVTYFHLLFASHQLVFSDGAVSESLFPGFENARTAHAQGQRELARLFGADLGLPTHSRTVRPALRVREAMVLA